MTRSLSLVQQVQIASPCQAKWDDMAGDDCVRFCDSCKLNVYNISAMSETEGEELIRKTEGRLCARMYRRYDGTILTKDCPVGWRALRRRAMWISLRAIAAMVSILASVTVAVHAGRPRVKVTPEVEQFLADMEARRPPAFVTMAASAKRWLTMLPPPPTRRIGVCGNAMMGRMASRPFPSAPSPTGSAVATAATPSPAPAGREAKP